MNRLLCPLLKKCPGCKQEQFVDNFYPIKSSKRSYVDALGVPRVGRCKSCQAQYYQDRDVRSKLLDAARKRAKAKGIVFNLTLEDIEIPDVCPILGTRLDGSSKKPPMINTTAPSIDRLDPSKGYTKDNVRIICARANSLKGNATASQSIAIALYVARETGFPLVPPS
jgi:hypothetical protein